MNETTVVVGLVFLVVGMVSGLILLLRKPAGEIEEIEAGEQSKLPGCQQWTECPQETIENIFGSDDLGFMRAKGPQTLRRAFQRDRRQIALKWVWGAYAETRRVMSQHLKAARSSADLNLTLEARLVAEYLLHQAACLIFVGVVRLAGPAGLAGFAAAIGNLRHHVSIVMVRVLGAGDDFDPNSGLRTHS
jgi:hypothetical protein